MSGQAEVQERTAPVRIAVCQHPNGEGVWWDADRHGPGCVQACDCVPVVYVREPADQLRKEKTR